MHGITQWATAAAFSVSSLGILHSVIAAPPLEGNLRVELDARRLVGQALYENDKFIEAADEFRRCIEVVPDSAADHFNLGLALMRAHEYDESLVILNQARALDLSLLAASYVRGITFKRLGKYEKAIENLERVVASDPQCMGAYYNLGICYKFLQQHGQAIDAFGNAARLAPQHPSSHYQLMTLYRRMGDVDKAKQHRRVFDLIKDKVDESEKTVEALERSKYSYIIRIHPLSEDLQAGPPGRARFADVTAEAGLARLVRSTTHLEQLPVRLERTSYDEAGVRRKYVPSMGGGLVLADYDRDGDLDIYVVNCASTPADSANRLFRNDGRGRFSDVTEAAGIGDTGLGLNAVFGDYDNDGHEDLYVANYGPNVLYHNEGDGSFKDVSKDARANEPQFGRKAVFVDYDHDNDLDLFIGNQFDLMVPPTAERFTFPDGLNGVFDTLLRNNGDGTFTDRTDEAGLLVELAQTSEVLFADFDADNDIDLFVVNRDAPPLLFTNARLGEFTVGGSFSPPIGRRVRAAAEGDFNHDARPDLFLAMDHGLFLYTNAGRAEFTGRTIALPDGLSVISVERIDTLDYNNDGWSDVLLLGGGSLYLLAGSDKGEFRDVTFAARLSESFGQIADFASGDVDGDGDVDIVLQTRDRGVVLLTNDNPTPANWLGVRVVGRKVNRSGIGATVEIAAGGHYQRHTVRAGAVHFGIGKLTGVDVVRVTWPNGVAQNVIRPSINDVLTIEERVKVSASCGFLYAFNGRGFELINEILGIGPLGVPITPGVYHQPDCTELTKIESGQLADKQGFYDFRLTEELREVMYADQITLRIVDHPAELEVIPNEMFTAPPFPEDKFFAVADHRSPLSAVDDTGADVLDLVRERDGRVPTFGLTNYDGLAQTHSLTLDLGGLSGVEQGMLFLDGWIYWPDSSTVMAIAQDPSHEFTPLSLDVRDDQGRWQRAIESVGLPTSKGAVVPVDLSGRFLCDDHHVRLSTNMCIYFDRIFVSTRDQADRCRMSELPVAHADLHYRGFSQMSRDALGFERFDYDEVGLTGSWSPPAGLLTRYGDVTPLLARPDNMYVIFGPGDELSLRFDATKAPELPEGWTRDFVFYANGWVKDGDLNTKFSESITPLPFHGMSGYPYPTSENYPRTPEIRRYLREYINRPAEPTVGVLTIRARETSRPASPGRG